MIDKWDIQVLGRWLYLARRYGTDAIKIVAGDRPGEYKVTVNDPERPFSVAPMVRERIRAGYDAKP